MWISNNINENKIRQKSKLCLINSRFKMSAFERFLLLESTNDIWCTILDCFAHDAITLARFSMVSKGCQRQVFALLKNVLTVAAPHSTAAPNSNIAISLRLQRNDYVLPLPLLTLWWTDKNSAIIATQYDRLEGLGYYQAVVRAGLLQKKRVVTNDRYSKARVPHSALRFEKMLEILDTKKFRRSKSLYERAFPVEQQRQQRGLEEQPSTIFTHDSFYEPDCQGGIVYCLSKFMAWEQILPDFDRPNWDEHSNIIMHSGRKKYRECELYENYMASVACNLHRLPEKDLRCLWSHIPLTMRLLVCPWAWGSAGRTIIKW